MYKATVVTTISAKTEREVVYTIEMMKHGTKQFNAKLPNILVIEEYSDIEDITPQHEHLKETEE